MSSYLSLYNPLIDVITEYSQCPVLFLLVLLNLMNICNEYFIYFIVRYSLLIGKDPEPKKAIYKAQPSRRVAFFMDV